MQQIISKKFIDILFIILFASITDLFAGEQIINREIAGLQLGMSFQEAAKVFKMEEKEDGVIALMRKFGFGDPEKQERINKKLGKQVFSIKGNLSEGLSSMDCFFRNGILYQIALHYGEDYVAKIDWDLFTLPAIMKYGQPTVFNNIQNMSSFSYQWVDGQTELEIAKGGTLSEDKNKFTTTLYNVFYTDIKAYNVMKEDEKNETERSTIVPKF